MFYRCLFEQLIIYFFLSNNFKDHSDICVVTLKKYHYHSKCCAELWHKMDAEQWKCFTFRFYIVFVLLFLFSVELITNIYDSLSVNTLL